jgi:hypothetical protein
MLDQESYTLLLVTTFMLILIYGDVMFSHEVS